MTDNQVQLLDFIRVRIETKGAAPNYDEMVEHTGRGRQAIFDDIDALERDGHLVKVPGRPRGLRLSYRTLVDVPTDALRAELARREAAI
ncbi:LexA family protein [Sphingopyxis macrogoltabida]|uniref:LexA repressor DNA-binding domain-containing protein n=1 Tax=Sphingopyxis macrogoltabida TaxID=33050 RepID=A0AAC8Z2A3_SPHMC|nr:hypothetical protein [Sphingopyxis macrogoltabida]ALJ14241.1 hypothetical protein LH19_15330 [Sphingopyxis macrogoltabida]AMU90507.1 hypothetical protein ATM17_15905 [Sphingopyxis macrogoltabida]